MKKFNIREGVSKTDLTLTLECNNNCEFCPREELSTITCKSNKEIYETIGKIGRESKSIALSGGEVTIRKDFFSILDHCKKSGIMDTGIVTNGRMFSYSSFTKNVLKMGVSSIIVSLYSTKKEIHESITRSGGSLRQTLGGIKNILRLTDNPNILGINIVVSRNNLDDIENTMVELCLLGVKKFLLIDIVTEDEKHLYSYEMFANVLKRIIENETLLEAKITVRGFSPCIFNRKLLSERRVTIQPHDVDTLFYLNCSVANYIKNFNSKFSGGLERCKKCGQKNNCQGIQKSRIPPFNINVQPGTPLKKSFLREHFFKKMEIIHPAFKGSIDDIIIRKVLDSEEYKKSKNIVIFLEKERSVDLSSLIKHAKNMNKSLSVFDSRIMDFIPYGTKTTSKRKDNRYEIDLILTNCLSFSRSGRIVGMGYGERDRYFSLNKKLTDREILLAYSFQEVDQIETDSNDILLKRIFTEKENILLDESGKKNITDKEGGSE